LAEASGVTSSTISRIEKGQVKQLKLQTLLRLAHALDVPVDHLVNNTETIIPSELVRVDSTAEYILQRYEKLSARGREQLKNFVRFLAEQEESQAQGHV
jgi:transcriptional regulator with XRE-family HTH domain